MSLEMATKHIALELIRIDGGTQPRAEVNQEVIREYAQDMLLGVTFPPVALFYDGSNYWLADGFHRYYAAKQNCYETIAADVKQGTLLDAVWESLGANKGHGLRRTTADKQRSIETALRKFPEKSDREIARQCGVHHNTVGAMREKLTGEIIQSPIRVGADGRTYNTANIGHQQNLTPQEFVDEVFPGFTQWQQDNVEIGLTEWADVPLARAEPIAVPQVDEAYERYKEMQERRQQKEQQREQRRDENRQLITQARSIDEVLPVGARFATIVIDPPWDWGDEGDVDQFGRGRPTYGTMSLEQLLQLPVGAYADEDCHLYLWITNRSLPKGFQLLEAWGFRYVTCVTWVKPYFGMGNYFRGQTEHLLFGVKGSQPLKRHDAGTFFEAPRGPNGHSSKPIKSYELIESCSPGPYLELFARSQRPDWASWGAEA